MMDETEERQAQLRKGRRQIYAMLALVFAIAMFNYCAFMHEWDVRRRVRKVETLVLQALLGEPLPKSLKIERAYIAKPTPSWAFPCPDDVGEAVYEISIDLLEWRELVAGVDEEDLTDSERLRVFEHLGRIFGKGVLVTEAYRFPTSSPMPDPSIYVGRKGTGDKQILYLRALSVDCVGLSRFRPKE